MATTPNYGWVTPAPTDFVTDLPADFETFGDAVDASVKSLNPGTTAGDIDYYTSGTAKARLGIGTAGQVLTVNSGATAPEWTTIASGGIVQIATGSLSGSSVTLSSIPQTYKHLQLSLRAVSSNADDYITLKFNSVTSGYKICGVRGTTTATAFNRDNIGYIDIQGGQSPDMGSAYTDNSFFVNIYDYATTNTKKGDTVGFWNSSTNVEATCVAGFVSGDSSAAIDTIIISLLSGSFDNGTYTLWGVA